MDESIFAFGVPRSGTTLLRTMLDSHPNIACGPEFSLLSENVSRIWERNWPCIESFSKDQVALQIFHNFGFSSQDIHKFVAVFIDTIFSEYARRRNKKRWAIKIPRTVEKIDYLSQLFPRAFFIHIIRDGRDVVVSSRNQKRMRPSWYPNSGLEDFARDWVRMIKKARSDSKHVKHYMEIHYEDLVEAPEQTMRLVLSFLGEKWDEKILRYYQLEHDYSRGELSTADVQKPLFSNSIGRWQFELSEVERQRIIAIEGFKALLQEEGYIPDFSGALLSNYK